MYTKNIVFAEIFDNGSHEIPMCYQFVHGLSNVCAIIIFKQHQIYYFSGIFISYFFLMIFTVACENNFTLPVMYYHMF